MKVGTIMSKPEQGICAKVSKAQIIKPLLCFCMSLLAVTGLIMVLVHFAPTAFASNTAPVTTSAVTQAPTANNDAVSGNAESLLKNLTGVDLSQSIEVILLITVLSLAPSLLIMMTSFVRLIIVFSLLRSALGTNQTPPNQVLIGLALFLTLFIMAPTIKEINDTAYVPYSNGELSAIDATKQATIPLKNFMLKQVSNADMKFFLDLAGQEMTDQSKWQDLGLEVVVPAFMTSELKRAFTIGFLIFIPFLIIDIVVSSTLMALGMMMLPPAMISLPFKIMLFILVDGWQLLIGTLIKGFN